MYTDDEIRRMFPLEQPLPFNKLDKLQIGKRLPRKARFMFDNMAILEEERNSLYNDYIRKALGQDVTNCCSHKVYNTKIDNIPYQVDNVLHIQNPTTPVKASSSTNVPLSIGKKVDLPEEKTIYFTRGNEPETKDVTKRETIKITKNKSVAQQIREKGEQILKEVLSPGRGRKTRSKTRKEKEAAGSSTDPLYKNDDDLNV